MNLPDTNIWIALTLSSHEFHREAGNWFASQSRPHSILFCRSTQQSFLRLLTTPKFMGLYGIPAMTNAAASALVERLLADPRVAFAAEPHDIQTRWKSLATRNTSSSKLWMDAYLAAFARSGGHQLITIDKAFSQFKDLRPLILSKTRPR